MLQISEWLPNPVGTDTQGEWIELYNSGQATTLAGWAIKTSGKTKFVFKDGQIGQNQYLVLPRSETKLTLKNTNESLFLIDPAGKIVSQSSYLGAAPEGQSVNISGANNYFAEPTPGKANTPFVSKLAQITLPYETPINPAVSGTFPLWGLEVALATTAIIMFLIKRYADLSHLLFPRDEIFGSEISQENTSGAEF